jgi:hypothetical protein
LFAQHTKTEKYIPNKPQHSGREIHTLNDHKLSHHLRFKGPPKYTPIVVLGIPKKYLATLANIASSNKSKVERQGPNVFITSFNDFDQFSAIFFSINTNVMPTFSE